MIKFSERNNYPLWSAFPFWILFQRVIQCKCFQIAKTTLYEVNFNCEFYVKVLFDVKVFRAQKHTLIDIINFPKLAYCRLCTNLEFTPTIRTAHVEMRKCQIWIIELSWKLSLCRPNMCSTAPILVRSLHFVNIFLHVYPDHEYVFEHTLCLVGKCHNNTNKILNWEHHRLKMSPISILK